jgi:hypothetical protein
MPGYIKAALHKFQHPDPVRPKSAPHTWNPPVYGAKIQFIEVQEDSLILSPKDIMWIHQLAGTLLHYTRDEDPKFNMPVNGLASE